MSVQPAVEVATVATVDWAPVPRVNLMPPEILQARGFRVVKIRLAMAVLATVALAAGGVFWAQGQVSAAQQVLDATEGRNSVLRQDQTRYSDVPRLLSAVAAAKAAREQALGQDVLWFNFLHDVSLAMPSNVWLKNLTVTMQTGKPSAGGGTSTAVDPLVPTGIGSVTIVGTAADFPEVSAWLQSIARVNGLEASTLQNATRENQNDPKATGVEFTTQVVINAASLSHRYDRKAG